MRPATLLAGAILIAFAVPASACQLEMMMGMPQRYNAFAAYGAADMPEPPPPDQREPAREPRRAQPADTAPPEPVRNADGTPPPTPTMR